MSAKIINEYLEELRQQAPEKCRDCECFYLRIEFKPKGGWGWDCDVGQDDCYKEPTNSQEGINKT